MDRVEWRDFRLRVSQDQPPVDRHRRSLLWDAGKTSQANPRQSVIDEFGPALGFPHSSKVGSSRHPQMRELRTQSAGRPLRTLYAFNPLRSAILLIGGEKTGDDRWYEKFVPIADRLFERHLLELKKEGSI